MKWRALVKFNFWADNQVPGGEQEWEWHHFRQYVDPVMHSWGMAMNPTNLARPARREDDERERFYTRRASSEQFKGTLRGDGIKKQTIKLGNAGSNPGYEVHFWVRKSRVPDGASIEAASG